MFDHDLIRDTPDTRTWARVTTFESKESGDVETALRVVVDQVVPLSRDAPGWKGAMALATQDLVITLWDSVENMHASARIIGQELQGASEGTGLSVIAGSERLEIVLDERPD